MVQVKQLHPVQARSDTPVKVNGEPERWLVAARLSRMRKEDRERGDDLVNSIQTQDQRAAEWAQAEGHVIVHVTRDRNISGAVPPWERPELGPWLTDPVKIVQYDGIVAFSVDRLSREYFDLGWLRKWAEQHHKRLYVIKDRLRWPDNRDGVLWGVAAERAYQERQDIIERVNREIGALQDAGSVTGKPPFGYAVTGPKYDKKLVTTETGRTWVPRIYQWVIDGRSGRQIAAKLNAEGVITEPQMHLFRRIGDVIRNPVYRGARCKYEPIPPDEVETRDGRAVRYRYGDRWAEWPRWTYGRVIHTCEALVTPGVWKRANEALSSRATTGAGHVDPENCAMLARALHCPNCQDSPMYRIKSSVTSRVRATYHYYRCAGRGARRESCGNMVRVELADEAVNDIIAETFDVPVMEHRIVYGNEAEIEDELEKIRFEIRQLGARELPDDEYDAELTRLRAERDRVAATELVPDRAELLPTGDTYAGLWERLSTPERGAWLAAKGFRVYASKAEVRVVLGDTEAAISL